ncbi:gem-associated protein 8 [Periophthalmus magnuspinnatus]|uniref:gem-associated protein 8 n=1 Tax=Periophthalmus magnuspinnatus TaxID=409849 RepID=UPI00145B9161|nr:gem-associated protein 8 [Periophthalmus magnuspinnatus]
MDDVTTVMSWFSSPVYSRYWQHYSQAMGWYQRHRRAYHKALHAAYGPACYPQSHPSHARYTDWEAGEEEEEYDDEEEEEEEEESSSDNDIECDVSNMEISEELRQYFAQTEKHREELKKQQQEEEDYVPADQDLHDSSYRSSVAPPIERPGERRAAEMKKLYGKDAAKIMAMEAAMQLTFDRNCDLKQPKYWPVIPLKL